MRRRFLALLALALGLLVVAPAAADDIGQKASVDARIAALHARIAASQEQDGVLSSQLSDVVAELQDSQAAVDTAAVERRLARGRARLRTGGAGTALGTSRHRDHAASTAAAEYARAVAILEARVRTAYMDEPPDLLSFLVSASSFDDAVDNLDFLERLGRQDRQVATDVERAKREAVAQRDATIRTRRLRRRRSRSSPRSSCRPRRPRPPRRGAKSSRHGRVPEAGRARRHAGDARGVPRRGRVARGAECCARRPHPRRSVGLDGIRVGLVLGLHLALQRGRVKRLRHALGALHEGIDIACAYGTPAPSGGRHRDLRGLDGGVRESSCRPRGGLSTAYAHASSILASLGLARRRGANGSLAGATGHATGPHLHFEVRVNGTAVDPLSYL